MSQIRAMYNHLVRAAIADEEKQIITNLNKMESHSKRALIDCFKYTCMLCDDNYRDFMKRYEAIDLTYINQGQFLRSVTILRKQAVNAIKVAKEAESLNTSKEKLFSLYQKAYSLFENLNQMVSTAEREANFLKKKATKKEKLAIISFIIGIIGLIIGIISLFSNFIQ